MHMCDWDNDIEFEICAFLIMMDEQTRRKSRWERKLEKRRSHNPRSKDNVVLPSTSFLCYENVSSSPSLDNVEVKKSEVSSSIEIPPDFLDGIPESQQKWFAAKVEHELEVFKKDLRRCAEHREEIEHVYGTTASRIWDMDDCSNGELAPVSETSTKISMSGFTNKKAFKSDQWKCEVYEFGDGISRFVVEPAITIYEMHKLLAVWRTEVALFMWSTFARAYSVAKK
jgi:hypothetical protein